MKYLEIINVSREPQNRSLLYVNEDLRITLTLLRTQKSHYAMISFKGHLSATLCRGSAPGVLYIDQLVYNVNYT